MERTIDRVEIPAEAGANEQVQRKRMVVGPGDFQRQSPFLFLSEDWFAAPGGFETHPHRGMQTVTLMLDGALRHRDHTGADGVLKKGDVQWMTAGHGVLHSEMPHERETAHTLQLWLNLPADKKMIPARYVDQRLVDVPVRRLQGVEVRVYAGRSGEIESPHGSDWPMMLLDVSVAAGRELVQEIPAGWRGFLYALDGSAAVGAGRTPLAAPEVAWFEPSGPENAAADTLTIAAGSDFRGLLYAGPPIDEPVVAYGPFVMNTVDEIRQAFTDYQQSRFVA